MKKLHHVLQARKNAPGKTVKSSGTELPPITFLIPTPPIKVAQVTAPASAWWYMSAVFSVAFHSLKFFVVTIVRNFSIKEKTGGKSFENPV